MASNDDTSATSVPTGTWAAAPPCPQRPQRAPTPRCRRGPRHLDEGAHGAQRAFGVEQRLVLAVDLDERGLAREQVAGEVGVPGVRRIDLAGERGAQRRGTGSSASSTSRGWARARIAAARAPSAAASAVPSRSQRHHIDSRSHCSNRRTSGDASSGIASTCALVAKLPRSAPTSSASTPRSSRTGEKRTSPPNRPRSAGPPERLPKSRLAAKNSSPLFPAARRSAGNAAPPRRASARPRTAAHADN